MAQTMAERAYAALQNAGDEQWETIFTAIGRWSERTTTHICEETMHIRFSDKSRLLSFNAGPFILPEPRQRVPRRANRPVVGRSVPRG